MAWRREHAIVLGHHAAFLSGAKDYSGESRARIARAGRFVYAQLSRIFAGATVLVEPHSFGDRRAAMVQFPGGYIAEIHSIERK